VRRAHEDELPPLKGDRVDVGGVFSVLRWSGFRFDDGILDVNRECTAAVGFEEGSRG
jgi:hypothetical protein